MRLNRVRQAATIGSDADWQRAKEWLECEIHQVTPAEQKLFYKFFKHHEHQLLQEVKTKAIGPKIIFANKLAHMKTAAEQEVYGVANRTFDKEVKFQVRLSDAETEATTCSIADMNWVSNQLRRETYGITWHEQMWFKKKLSIRMIEFEARWNAIGV